MKQNQKRQTNYLSFARLLGLSHCIGPGMRIRRTRSVIVRTTPMRYNNPCENALCEGKRRRLRITGKDDSWLLVEGDSTLIL
ncbi:hypothetical protein MmiEs2_03980 [Methanimicrococcus stummii]|uniref:Uncharacterized protein n=1 Tax=Methanimicrococcus stummii TaxID=3028294 RepID=A0AA96V7W6_9EURY|nr:hypothetical protein MmiEs2_03980 [Methanimicrococcus sp. Es2]